MSNLLSTFEEAPFAYGLLFKDALFENLYGRQITYWNNRLQKISDLNIAAYAREDELFAGDTNFAGIFYDGEVFNLMLFDEDEEEPTHYCLEVYNDPFIIEEMKLLAVSLRKFKKERYIAQRFLASLTMFEPPPPILEEILGEGLYRICNSAFQKVTPEAYIPYSEITWPVKQPEALKTFVTEQKDIITAMQERVLLNMITL